jgi:hypothetical protein
MIALSAAFGAAALCLVVFGTSQKQLQLGVLLGLWAALIVASLLFRDRRGQPEAESAADLEHARAQAVELHEAQLRVVALQQEQLEAARQAYFTQEIELRQFGELQLARDAGARRESEQGLEISLRREIERVLVDQLGSLREEVAALRAEVVDKLGGQLRLERIETTRVIGSDLEALQHEIRRLAAVSQDGLAAAPVRAVSPPVRAVSPPVQPQPAAVDDIVDAELVEFPPPATELPQPVRVEQPERSVRVEQPEPPVRVEQPEPATDPFAALPRLSPVQADLDLIPDSRPTGAQLAEQPGRRRAPDPELLSEDARYQGRRRAEGAAAGSFASMDS